MYNRYIPQSDGTYRRRAVVDAPPPSRPAPVKEKPVQAEEPCEPEPTPCHNCVHNQPRKQPMPQRQRKNTQNLGIGTFLKQLLPRDFDTEDLLVVLLLLLMAGDCQEDQNSALLTLALYLFM